MANYTYRMMQVARHEFRLDTPTNATELEKLSAAAWAERVKQLGITTDLMPDDAINVDTDDDCIVLWWEVSG